MHSTHKNFIKHEHFYFQENSNQAGNQQTEDYILNCPKCNQVCPDLDSLQIHVLDCIEN